MCGDNYTINFVHTVLTMYHNEGWGNSHITSAITPMPPPFSIENRKKNYKR